MNPFTHDHCLPLFRSRRTRLQPQPVLLFRPAVPGAVCSSPRRARGGFWRSHSPALVCSVFMAAADQVARPTSTDPAISYAPLVERLERSRGWPPGRTRRRGHPRRIAHGRQDGETGARLENQSDARHNPIFCETDALTAGGYRLAAVGQRHRLCGRVSCPDAADEAGPNSSSPGLPLTRTWRNDGWACTAVAGPTAIVPEPLRLVEESPRRWLIEAPAAAARIRIRPTGTSARDDGSIRRSARASLPPSTAGRSPHPGVRTLRPGRRLQLAWGFHGRGLTVRGELRPDARAPRWRCPPKATYILLLGWLVVRGAFRRTRSLSVTTLLFSVVL